MLDNIKIRTNAQFNSKWIVVIHMMFVFTAYQKITFFLHYVTTHEKLDILLRFYHYSFIAFRFICFELTKDWTSTLIYFTYFVSLISSWPNSSLRRSHYIAMNAIQNCTYNRLSATLFTLLSTQFSFHQMPSIVMLEAHHTSLFNFKWIPMLCCFQ